MEQGTGKTKVILDTAVYRYQKGDINSLVIFADNGIHRNWINEELPQDVDPALQIATLIWQSDKTGTKWFKAAVDEFRKAPGLQIVAINIESLITEPVKSFLRDYLRKRQCLVAVDESTSIKTPGAKRTKTMRAVGQLAKVRRIMTGTPMAESPFNIYAPFQFLREGLLGHTSYLAFKSAYGRFVTRTAKKTGRSWQELDKNPDGSPAYQHLDVLKAKIANHSFTVSKDECLDLPPKTYQKHPFLLTPGLRAIYNLLRDEYLLEIAGRERPVALAITRKMRLHQITCALRPRSDDPEDGTEWLDENPRLEAFAHLMAQLPAKAQVLVWCRYRDDVTRVLGWLAEQEITAVRYDGAVNDDQREENKKAFQRGDARVFVGTQRAGGKGLTLNQASYAIYYSNDYPLEPRLQSEDRFHRMGQDKNVTIIDLVCQDTADVDIVGALRSKKELSDYMSDRPYKEWL